MESIEILFALDQIKYGAICTMTNADLKDRTDLLNMILEYEKLIKHNISLF